MSGFPRDLPLRSAPAGAALIVETRLEEARRASERLAEGGDPEALHDFRVAMRRLRAALRLYRPWLGRAARKRRRKRLKKIASWTGAGRDAEVQAANLRSWEPRIAAGRRAGVRWLRERLEAERDRSYGAGVERARNAFLQFEPDLREALPAPAEEQSLFFCEATADILHAAAGEFRDALLAIRSAEDVGRAHRARIMGKRLRCLVEPLASAGLRGWPRVLKRMKRLQDLLGELNDMGVIEGTIAEAGERDARDRVRRLIGAAGESLRPNLRAERRADPLPGLLAAAARASRERRLRYLRFRRQWRDDRSARFFGEIAALAEALRRWSRGVHTVHANGAAAPLPSRETTKGRAPRESVHS